MLIKLFLLLLELFLIISLVYTLIILIINITYSIKKEVERGKKDE